MNQSARISNLELGGLYSKKDLAEILKESILSQVREGIYSRQSGNEILLFVDLDKTGKEERFRFNDYFNGEYFEWDSQTTNHIHQPRIQSMVTGEKPPHLFVRVYPKIKGLTQPYVYAGGLEYLTHDPRTARPVHITFRALNFQDDTSNKHLQQVYSWKPISEDGQNKVEPPSRSVSPERKKNYKKPDKTERSGLVTSRVGQGYYRQNVRTRWDDTCPVTGVTNPSILIASHIKPWSKADEEERLDEFNGILLSPNADALFDRGLISFDENGGLVKSDLISTGELTSLGIDLTVRIKTHPKTKEYLEWHRKNILK